MIGEEVPAHSMSSYLTCMTQSRDILQGKNAETRLIHLFIGEKKST